MGHFVAWFITYNNQGHGQNEIMVNFENYFCSRLITVLFSCWGGMGLLDFFSFKVCGCIFLKTKTSDSLKPETVQPGALRTYSSAKASQIPFYCHSLEASLKSLSIILKCIEVFLGGQTRTTP